MFLLSINSKGVYIFPEIGLFFGMATSRGGVSTSTFVLVVAIMVLIVFGSIGAYSLNSRIVSLRNQNSQLQSENTSLINQNNQLSTIISNENDQISSLQSNMSNLQIQIGNLNDQIVKDHNQIISLNTILDSQQTQNTTLQKELTNLQPETNTVYGCGNGDGCTLTIWNACGQSGNACPISSGSFYSEGVPDTFDFDVQFSSTVPISVYFLSFAQFIQFSNCGNISCVSGQYQYYAGSTSLNGKFTLAEGCGGYVAVFQSLANGYMYPDVSITYNPSPSTTGVCA